VSLNSGSGGIGAGAVKDGGADAVKTLTVPTVPMLPKLPPVALGTAGGATKDAGLGALTGSTVVRVPGLPPSLMADPSAFFMVGGSPGVVSMVPVYSSCSSPANTNSIIAL